MARTASKETRLVSELIDSLAQVIRKDIWESTFNYETSTINNRLQIKELISYQNKKYNSSIIKLNKNNKFREAKINGFEKVLIKEMMIHELNLYLDAVIEIAFRRYDIIEAKVDHEWVKLCYSKNENIDTCVEYVKIKLKQE